MLISLAACVTGFLLDFVFGDPVWLYHPVRVIGNFISFGERKLRGIFGKTEKGELAAVVPDGRIFFCYPLSCPLGRAEAPSGASVPDREFLVLPDPGGEMPGQGERKSL